MTQMEEFQIPSSKDNAKCVGSALARFMRRFISLPGEATIVMAVWIIHTYIFDCFEFTPYLNILSPEPGCGKSTTGEILASLSRNAIPPTCGTAAVLRRLIASQPTLIVDEWDSLNHGVRDACTNFLNTGFKSTGSFLMMEEKSIVRYSTFCPKVIVGRATAMLPEATLTRTIPVTLHKAMPSDNLEKFKSRNHDEALELRARCHQWGSEFRDNCVYATPSFPPGLNDRQQDICEPLLAIAEVLGGDWPQYLSRSLTKLLESRQRNMKSPGNELLRAVREYAREHYAKEFLSQDFCNWANAQVEKPWSDRPLKPAKLADILRVYNLHPRQINRMVNARQKNCRGYVVAEFDEVFQRYLDSNPVNEAN